MCLMRERSPASKGKAMNDMDSGVVEIRDAEAWLPDLIGRVENGEEIILGRSGEPAAKLTPIPHDFDPDSLGDQEGEIWVNPDMKPSDPLFFCSS